MDCTTTRLKQIIAEKTGGRLPPNRQEITWKGVELGMHRPDTKLADLGVGEDSTLELKIKPKEQEEARRALVSVGRSGGEGTPKKLRRGERENKRFTGVEAENLVEGVNLFGLGRWAEILHHSFAESGRTSIDLKDKWRNMCVAAGRPADFKFRADYLTPELLSKVRTVRAEAERRGRMVKEEEERKIAKERETKKKIAAAKEAAAAAAADNEEGEQEEAEAGGSALAALPAPPTG